MRIIKNLKVTNKLFTLIIISALVAIIIGFTAFKETTQMSQDMEAIYEEKFVPNNWIHNAINVNLRIDSIIIGMIMTTDLEEKKQLHSEINNGVDQVLSDLAEYEKMNLSQEEIEGLEDFYDAVNRLTNNQDEVIRLALEGQEDEAYKLFREIVQDARLDLITALTNLADIKMKQTEEISNKNVAAAEKTAKTIIIISIIGIVLLITIGLMIASSLIRPINQLNSLLGRVRGGDFTVKGTYESKDELGQLTNAFNDTIDTLNGALNNVRTAAGELEDSANELSANVNQSTTSSQHIVSSIQEISSGAEQTKYELENNNQYLQNIQHGLQQIETTMGLLHQLATNSASSSSEGAEIVRINVDQMQQIKQSIEQSNAVILNLAEQVNSVDEILNVINAISGQTNLLALNAAIEAARAGEHGKGFAVVADEVRKLAEQSLESTKSISTILATIKEDTTQSVKIMEVVMNNTDEGILATENTAQKFAEILESSVEVTPQIDALTQTMDVLNNSFAQFLENGEKITTIAVNNAENSELVTAATEQQFHAMDEMNSTAHSLSEVATQLNAITQQFKIK